MPPLDAPPPPAARSRRRPPAGAADPAPGRAGHHRRGAEAARGQRGPHAGADRRGRHRPVHGPLPQGGDRRPGRGAAAGDQGARRGAGRARQPGARRCSSRSPSQGKLTDELFRAHRRHAVEDRARGPVPALQAQAAHAGHDRARARARAAGRHPVGAGDVAGRHRARRWPPPFVSAEKEVPDVEAAWAGARDIVAERIADSADARAALRALALAEGVLRSRSRRARATSPSG